MKLLYSNILPLGTEDNQQTIADCFEEQLSKSDRIEIAVGYVSRASLSELDCLVEKYQKYLSEYRNVLYRRHAGRFLSCSTQAK